MKRLRHIFNGLTALSLLLAIATAGLWVRSYLAMDRFGLQWRLTGEQASRTKTLFCDSYRGRISIQYDWKSEQLSSDPIKSNVEYWHDVEPPADDWMSEMKGGFVLESYTKADWPTSSKPLSEFVTFAFPNWFPLLLSLLAPSLWVIGRLISQRRAGQNHCPTCGYDMRANPAKCSECGRVPAKS